MLTLLHHLTIPLVALNLLPGLNWAIHHPTTSYHLGECAWKTKCRQGTTESVYKHAEEDCDPQNRTSPSQNQCVYAKVQKITDSQALTRIMTTSMPRSTNGDANRLSANNFPQASNSHHGAPAEVNNGGMAQCLSQLVQIGMELDEIGMEIYGMYGIWMKLVPGLWQLVFYSGVSG